MRQMYQMRRRAGYNRDWTFPTPGSLPMGKVVCFFGLERMGTVVDK